MPRSLFSVPQWFLFIRLLRSDRKSGPHFLCREKVTKSGRGAPRAPVRGDSPPAGGVGPACRSIRGRIRASTGPLVGLALPGAQLQGGGRQPSPPLVVAGSGLTFPPWVGWLLPRGAGLRRQSRHPCKANTERRSGRGTRVSGVIPSRFCCPAAIKYPAGAVSSLPVESLAVVQPAATGGGGNGSGTERRLVLAVGFQGVYPLVSLWLLSSDEESNIMHRCAESGTKIE